MTHEWGESSISHLNLDDLVAWTRDWGGLLRSARQVAGLSLAALSERTGLSRGYLSKLESGQDGARNPSRATLVALARALPSFRPLAYQLEPLGAPQQSVSATLGEMIPGPAPRSPHMLFDAATSVADETEVVERPIQLGWREFEALVALLALERTGIPINLTARLIARAADRPIEQMRQTLDRLCAHGALVAHPPHSPGAQPTFARGPAFEGRLGLSRLGDALILAAALLSQASIDRPARRSQHSVAPIAKDDRI
jgi:hypothetical protein